jgi:hypothetical protein
MADVSSSDVWAVLYEIDCLQTESSASLQRCLLPEAHESTCSLKLFPSRDACSQFQAQSQFGKQIVVLSAFHEQSR